VYQHICLLGLQAQWASQYVLQVITIRYMRSVRMGPSKRRWKDGPVWANW